MRRKPKSEPKRNQPPTPPREPKQLTDEKLKEIVGGGGNNPLYEAH